MTRTITSVAAFLLGGLVTLQVPDAARNHG
jgi:hypothetical protein